VALGTSPPEYPTRVEITPSRFRSSSCAPQKHPPARIAVSVLFAHRAAPSFGVRFELALAKRRTTAVAVEDRFLFRQEQGRPLEVDEPRLVLRQRGVGVLPFLAAESSDQIVERFPPQLGDAVENLTGAARGAELCVEIGVERVGLDVAEQVQGLEQPAGQGPCSSRQ